MLRNVQFKNRYSCSLQLVNLAILQHLALQKDLSNFQLQDAEKPGCDKQCPSRFNSLGLLNFHKELTDKLDLAEVGNEFIFSMF